MANLEVVPAYRSGVAEWSDDSHDFSQGRAWHPRGWTGVSRSDSHPIDAITLHAQLPRGRTYKAVKRALHWLHVQGQPLEGCPIARMPRATRSPPDCTARRSASFPGAQRGAFQLQRPESAVWGETLPARRPRPCARLGRAGSHARAHRAPTEPAADRQSPRTEEVEREEGEEER